jgi:hypothetical protein
VRIASLCAVATALVSAACASAPSAGLIADGSTLQPRILGADTASPPRSATIQLDRAGYVALLLVAPGHSVTLLYPRDSATNNQMGAGTHQISFQIPSGLVLSDTAEANRDRQRRRDSARAQPRTRTVTNPPIDPTLGAFLLLVTSPQRLDYARMVERTSGVSLPTIDSEALNAVAKTIKGTLATEPRELAGYYQRLELGRLR